MVKMIGGGKGLWMRDGDNSEKGLKWSQVRVIKEFFQKHFETEVDKGKNCSYGEGYVTSCPPSKNLIVHHGTYRDGDGGIFKSCTRQRLASFAGNSVPCCKRLVVNIN